ncbi:TPA: hypothetical protein P6N70_000647 [Pseudomonas aeruginosa]|jgi:hypothetical protein|uniref:hypothetical protein n=1 Tax=Pseudomonadota TaxID=1224 RepID=UPI00071BBCCE|nr:MULTISPECIES: hypothetical protein [Pseudomonadota]KSC65518.1 hypothetical protein AO883_01475 [Pseudomonas aeruginosa]MCF3953795.1 hypothetical protein [Pseudomonas aeruginosa]MCW4894942.1 hypothetical protein [Enterobacter hormaechei subsp. xiangfangensis]MCW4946457.1 hypothetical protein [Enterobacter hormaechei subsp. xiangfangensis]MCY4798060.1 hypothetical protein [Pseudomonas aeruginosa]
MSEKKGFIARLFGKQEDSACCAVRIEEMPKTEVPQMPVTKKSACCAVRIEEVKDDDVIQPPPATQ